MHETVLSTQKFDALCSQVTHAWKAGFEARMALASVITNMAKVRGCVYVFVCVFRISVCAVPEARMASVQVNKGV